jgi:hypothetical protein
MNAHFLGTYRGKRYYRFIVLVECNIGAHPGASDLTHQVCSEFEVIAPTAADALWLVKDDIGPKLPAPTEFTTWGPGKLRRGSCTRQQGKATHHFMGWNSLIGAQMFESRKTHIQEELCFQS